MLPKWEVLTILAADEVGDVRRAVARHRATPAEVREALSGDPFLNVHREQPADRSPNDRLAVNDVAAWREFDEDHNITVVSLPDPSPTLEDFIHLQVDGPTPDTAGPAPDQQVRVVRAPRRSGRTGNDRTVG